MPNQTLSAKLQKQIRVLHINRFGVEWFPFFDRGYYERRYR